MEVRKIMVLINFTLVYKEYNFQVVVGHMLTYVVTSLLAIAGNFLVILAILLSHRDAKNLNPISSFFSFFFFQQKCNMAHQML